MPYFDKIRGNTMINTKKIRAALTLLLSLALLILPVLAADGQAGVKLTSDRTTDVLILLDCSGAVGELTNECASALDTLIDLMPRRGTRAAVVAYGNTWNQGYEFGSELSYMNDDMGAYARTRVCLAAEMTALSDGAEQVKSAVSSRLAEERFTHGNNYLGGGLMASLDLLIGSASDDASIVILTDGRLSGFDSTDGVEWKSTNRELVDEALDLAASKGFRLYPVELNTDSRNNPTSAARQLMSDLASKTGGENFVISSASDLKSAVISVYADIFGADVTDSLSPALPTQTSEVSVVLDGNVTSVSVGGKSYSKGSGGAVAFTDNVFKLCPASGKPKFTLTGGSAVKTVITERLPLVLELSHASPMTRGNTLDIRVYLGTSSSLDVVSDEWFYNNSEPRLSVGSENLTTTKDSDGWKASYEFNEPGSFVITAKVGDEIVTTNFEVADYGFEVDAPTLSDGEIVTVRAFLTGVEGRLTDSLLYRDNEAVLTVRRDGVVVNQDLKMTAGEGYYLDYTADGVGEYTFSVSAESPDGRLEAEKIVDCGDYTLIADWNADDGSTLQKSDHVKLSAKLLDSDGNVIARNAYLHNAKLRAERGGEVIENIPFTIHNGVLSADWRVSREGDIKLVLGVNGEESTVEFKVVNHAPVLVSDKFEGKCRVGETLSFSVSDFVGDADGDLFTITANGVAPDWKLSDDAKTMIFDVGGKAADYDFTLTFDDNDASVDLPVKIKVTNEKPKETASLVLPHFILKAPGFMFFVDYDDQAVSYELNNYFSDPEGLPLVYSLETPTDMAKLNGSVLDIDPRQAVNERLRLTVTDSSGDSINIDLRFTVDEWWTLNLKRVLIVAGIAAVILILIAVVIRRESNIGYLRVASAKRNGEELDLNEKLNPRRVRLWSLPLSKFITNRVRDAGDLTEKERGVLTGHLIFGKKVTLKGSTADGFERNGEVVEKLPKKIVLRSGESVTLVYGDLRVTITNRN